MKKWIYISCVFLIGIVFQSFEASTSKILTCRTGHIWFHSATSLEVIESHNYQVSSLLNPVSGEIEFSVLMKGFEFRKALMQEHFNTNYVESDKYPHATFKGIVENIDAVNFKKNGIYPVTITGDLTIHGVTNRISQNGTLTVNSNSVIGKSSFKIRVADYKINIPKLVESKVAQLVDVNVEIKYH